MVKLYHQQIDACFAETIGSGGLPRALFRTLLDEIRPAVAELGQSLRHGSLPILSLPARRDDLERLAPIAERLRDGFADLVVLGTGGSSLGAQALAALAANRCQPRLHFPDNLDGEAFAALLAGLDAT